MLPPSELTLPEQDQFFRMEYGVAVVDIVSCFERLDHITKQVARNSPATVVNSMLADAL